MLETVYTSMINLGFLKILLAEKKDVVSSSPPLKEIHDICRLIVCNVHTWITAVIEIFLFAAYSHLLRARMSDSF